MLTKCLLALIVFVACVSSRKLPKEECTIIKNPMPIPPVGVVCANPDRAQLIAKEYFDWYFTHTDFRGYKVYVGEYKGVQLFSTYTGLGSASAAFMMEELVANGAEVVIRLGTNDYNVTERDVNNVYVVNECHGLTGLMRDYGYPDEECGSGIPASKELVHSLLNSAPKFPEVKVVNSTGYNIDAFYSFFDPENVSQDETRVKTLIKEYEHKRCNCRDMETCAVLLVGQMRGIKTAAVLQAVVKSGKKHEGTGTTGIKIVLETLHQQSQNLHN
ncbi:purine nucleoside phosphorylase [Acrasis kona]|uniref:Purine nucleoside phosphorylase n=1 Tax=Acrasis kona TaxID=1008807 RepID=A0AAW2Z269_9EUKA